MEYRDYYKLLGVTRTATAEDIKKSYRRLARKYHPDVSKEPQAEERFKQLQEAYEVLKDTDKRAAYDRLGADWKQGEQFRPPPDWAKGFDFNAQRGSRAHAGAGAAGPGFEDGNYSDFFSSMFGGGGPSPFRGGRQRPTAGRDQHADIELELEEAHHGTTRTLALQRQEPGGGTREQTVRVNIPAGITAGQSVRLAGQGEPSIAKGGRAGDLYLDVRIRPHRLFELNGRDVTLTLPVAPWEAALGATVTVPTLGGTVGLRIPPGSQSGGRMRLRARGLAGDPPGDQYVVLKVVLPPADSEQAKALYEKMQAELAFDPRPGM